MSAFVARMAKLWQTVVPWNDRNERNNSTIRISLLHEPTDDDGINAKTVQFVYTPNQSGRFIEPA